MDGRTMEKWDGKGKKKLLSAIKIRKLWRPMIAYVLKEFRKNGEWLSLCVNKLKSCYLRTNFYFLSQNTTIIPQQFNI